MKIDLIEKYIETDTHHFLIVHYRKWFIKKTLVVFRKKGLLGSWRRFDNGDYVYDLEIVSKNDYLELIDYNGLITSDDVRHRIDLKTSETRQKEILERVGWALFFIIITLLASLLLKIG